MPIIKMIWVLSTSKILGCAVEKRALIWQQIPKRKHLDMPTELTVKVLISMKK